ncbi:MAG TPA: molybdenum cofactor biosynthesis protein MoaE [Acetobacteraceae bacterium]|jgi:molybdopterin synthase catalytic subunit
MATIRVQTADFDIGAEIAALVAGRADIGGIGSFVGTVRNSAGGRQILAMTLEHYPAMTEQAMRRVAAEAESRFPILGCTLIHRVGRLLPGENIVLVAAVSPHRKAALDATAFLIDWLKTSAPFWKKESFADGAEAWVEARAEDEQAASGWNKAPPPAS